MSLYWTIPTCFALIGLVALIIVRCTGCSWREFIAEIILPVLESFFDFLRCAFHLVFAPLIALIDAKKFDLLPRWDASDRQCTMAYSWGIALWCVLLGFAAMILAITSVGLAIGAK